jgi:hypothetical protein
MPCYRVNVSDVTAQLVPCTYQPSVRAPGRTICYSENGLALVVEPSGLIRDLRPGEEADSPWCWADRCAEFLVYRTDPAGPTVVGFRIVESA